MITMLIYEWRWEWIAHFDWLNSGPPEIKYDKIKKRNRKIFTRHDETENRNDEMKTATTKMMKSTAQQIASEHIEWWIDNIMWYVLPINVYDAYSFSIVAYGFSFFSLFFPIFYLRCGVCRRNVRLSADAVSDMVAFRARTLSSFYHRHTHSLIHPSTRIIITSHWWQSVNSSIELKVTDIRSRGRTKFASWIHFSPR